jgi:hypothetical protein
MWAIFTKITEPAIPISPSAAPISSATLPRFRETNHYLGSLLCDCVRAGRPPSPPGFICIEAEVCRVLGPEAALKKMTVILQQQMRESP